MNKPQRHRDHREADNEVSGSVVDAAVAVHRELGPGLLESIYEQALAYELTERGLRFARQKALPVRYKDGWLDGEFRLDFLVEDRVVVELKSVERMEPVYEAQLLTYLRLSGIRLGLLLNFNVRRMREGIRRRIFDVT